jgi:hypothetical protein
LGNERCDLAEPEDGVNRREPQRLRGFFDRRQIDGENRGAAGGTQ